MKLNATLTAWNPSTGALTYSFEGGTQTSTVVSTTTPHRALLHKYVPNDPVIPIVQQWNALFTKGHVTFGDVNPPTDTGNTFSKLTGQLVAAGAHMEINLKPKSNIVASLRPTP
ncbi:hypothetical protein [Peribacillus butanolivorans]|uniref:hypothetical protein n=1 Tax=Peribacillus butanolivorans TaxID=421767 RepID=UPI003818FD2B